MLKHTRLHETLYTGREIDYLAGMDVLFKMLALAEGRGDAEQSAWYRTRVESVVWRVPMRSRGVLNLSAEYGPAVTLEAGERLRVVTLRPATSGVFALVSRQNGDPVFVHVSLLEACDG